MGRIVVLLGPPASGKSTLGEELGHRGLRWREWEPELLARWGGLDGFVANKTAALEQLHRDILAWVDSEPTPAVIETTGLSDADFLDRLQAKRPETVVVRLDIPEDEALRRLRQREQGRHLSDDEERNRATLRAYRAVVLPARKVSLALDTATIDVRAAAVAVLSLLR